VRPELESIEIPGESGARVRAWSVLSAALADRRPVEHRPRMWRSAIAIVVVVAALAAVLSSSGRAVLDEIREVVGVERAQPALFSLPAPGRLLVASDAGVWVVQQDGSKRLLGTYREASWSPFGRYVVATRENELAALEPNGNVRWTLARPGVRFPRWTGTETDTRIAYVDRTGIRVVAGDGTGDRLLLGRAGGPIAWRPGDGFALAHTTPKRVRVIDAATGDILWQAPRPAGRVTAIEWSSRARRLLVLTPHHLRVYDMRGRIADEESPAENWPDVDASFRPETTEAAVVRVHGSQSSAYILSGRPLTTVTGVLRELEWAPNGRWAIITWETADQWILARAGGRHFRGVANVSEQFRSRSFPRVEGWCCTP
jgi:hypothetical protein